MAVPVSGDVRASPPPDEVTAVRAARWYTLAAAVVGVLNYGYALVLTRLLDVGAYSRFAAGQGLILTASTVAVVAVPWVLAQSLARAGSSAERGDAVRFTIVIGVGGGLVASAGVAAVASQFAGPATLVALAVSTLLIFASTVTVGWLQGSERLRILSALTVGEAGLKTGAGLVLASAAGLGEAGALAAFGVGVLPFLLWWPPLPPGSGRWWRGAAATRDLWRRALGIAGVQGLVALLAAVDVVVVALLPTDRAAAASYQASVVAARSPVFLASAISVAFFPALSRRRAGTLLTRRALGMYIVAALPLTAVLVTAPAAVISAAFPARYGMVAELLRYTALSGFAVGGVNLATTFFQADDDYSCTRWQAIGVLGYLVALLVGWKAGGILGFAIGAACGACASLVLLIYLLARRQRIAGVGQMRLLEPLALAGLLTLLRPHLVLWLIAAGGVALRTADRFLLRPRTLEGRPGKGARSGLGEIPDNGGITDMTNLRPVIATDQSTGRPDVRRGWGRRARARAHHSASRLLVDAVWRRRAGPATDAVLQNALTQARRNRVEGELARAYPRQLEEVVSRVQEASESFRHNLCQVAELLRTAGIPAVLIKADMRHDYVYGNFDLVVRAEHWPAARAALEGWYVHRSTYWLERSTKLLLEPRFGPSAHLHTAVSWFGVPVIGPTELFDRAVPDDTQPWLVPHPAEQLRIWLAHAVFQNLALDLLGAARYAGSADPRGGRRSTTGGGARGLGHRLRRCVADGGRDHAHTRSWSGRPAAGPAPRRALPESRGATCTAPSLPGTKAHSDAGGDAPGPACGREAPEGPRRMKHRGQSFLVGVSGPDGVGKTTLIDQLAHALRGLRFHPITAYGYGCVVCRRMPAGQLRQPPPGSGWRSRRAAIGMAVRPVHAVVDASELAIRLAAARFRARATGRRCPTVVLTDRGPLDGLVKFDVAPTSTGAALFRRMAARYDVTLLLDAPPEVLASRDATDSLDQVADRCRRYRRWGRRVPAVVLVDSGRQPSAVLAVALRSILDRRWPPAKSTGHPDRDTAREHVVLSNFDDITNPHYRGGGAVVIDKLARSLAEDFRVTVVTAGQRGGTDVRGEVCYRYLPVGWAGPRAGQLLFHAALPIIARRLQHDLWMESFTPPFSTSFLPLVSPAPVVGIGQQLSGEAMRQRYHVPFDIVERFGLRFYRDVVVLNDTDREILRRRNPAAAVHLIPNGIDRRRVSETHFGHGEHILFLGRIDLHCKGLDLLLRAYAQASPPMPLVLAGSGTPSQERKLARMLAENGRGVKWVGQVDGARKLDLLVRSAFLVLPSRNESFGIAALEAMSWGKPVLHFDVPGLRWMRGDGDVPVVPFDTDDLATKICELAADVQLRRRLGGKAYLAAQRYSWEETTARYRSLVRHLLDRSALDGTGILGCDRLR